uniref:Uncharacterized protein n=1 Tax=Oreochromis niloticus TaxID=8128 RepID=A0A669EUE7_ORENI
MGNWESFRRDNRESRKEPVGKEPNVPEITVTEASPLSPERSFFSVPGPAHTGRTGQVLTAAEQQAESESQESLSAAEGLSVTMCRKSAESQHRSPFGPPESQEEEEEERVDTHSLSGSDDNSTPRGSRKHFIEVMMNSSPAIRRSFYLSPRAEADSTSMVSSTLDEDRTAVALEPMEHEWMMCASDGQWSSLHRLLTAEPSLILKKDFVTGFTCLHWAAKHGKPELIAMIINFAKLHNISVSIDIRSSTGYTPLHIAAIHGHVEVVKLLVRTYNADVEIRDYSGRKACQYLTDNVSVDIRSIVGGCECSAGENSHPRDGRPTHVLNVLLHLLLTPGISFLGKPFSLMLYGCMEVLSPCFSSVCKEALLRLATRLIFNSLHFSICICTCLPGLLTPFACLFYLLNKALHHHLI